MPNVKRPTRTLKFDRVRGQRCGDLDSFVLIRIEIRTILKLHLDQRPRRIGNTAKFPRFVATMRDDQDVALLCIGKIKHLNV